jgi:hypothetical protein
LVKFRPIQIGLDPFLINENKKIKLFNSGSSRGIDEVFWVSESKLLLVGSSYLEESAII